MSKENALTNLFGRMESLQQIQQGKDIMSDFLPKSKTKAYNVLRNKDGFHITVPVPGLSTDQVKISTENGILAIQGTYPEKDDVEGDYVVYAFEPKNFKIEIQLPRGTSYENISADMCNGLLRLKVARPDELKPREITINEGISDKTSSVPDSQIDCKPVSTYSAPDIAEE